MTQTQQSIRERLFAMQDREYRAFQQRLMPTVPPETVIGVRTPQLRALARELAGTGQAEQFCRALPHRYYEENNLHGYLLEREKDYAAALAKVEAFLPYVNNWATCDTLNPRVFGRHLPELLGPVRRWLDSGQTYTVRFGLGTLMRWYLDEAFRPEYLEWAAAVQSEEYYIKMMVAWYFATALAKQPQAAWPYLEQRRLDRWTHNKTIQKAVESRRIPAETKRRLQGLRWKGAPEYSQKL